MTDVCILSEDKRLKHEISLLLPQVGFTALKSGASLLYIVDADTVSDFKAPEGARVLTVSRKGGERVLRRPFTIDAFYGAVKRAFEGEELFPLSATEAKLLSLLREADGEPISRKALIEGVWGNDGNDGLLNLYVHYLRQKIEGDGKKRIFSARGKGYFYKC